MFRTCDSGPETMTRVRRAHSTRIFVAVESEHITVQLIVPKIPIKLSPKPVRHPVEDFGTLGESETRSDTRRRLLGPKYVSLNFTKCDWRRGQYAITIENRVVRILPSLLGQSLFRFSLILHVTVFVEIAVGIHPIKRSKNIRPNFLNKPDVLRVIEVRTRQHYK